MFIMLAEYVKVGTYECAVIPIAAPKSELNMARPNVSWQEIEAPLFSMRSMGAELDVGDEKAVPKIMDLILRLPSHPRIRYAALLIISRYTEWINKHPVYIAPQLKYISAGFEDSDNEVTAAAGQALRYLCQDCKQVRVGFVVRI